MQQEEPTFSVAVVVCCHQREGRACCRNGAPLRDRLRDWARDTGMKSRLVFHKGSCMGVCGPGTTVALHGPEEFTLLSVEPGDEAALCARIRRAVMQ